MAMLPSRKGVPTLLSSILGGRSCQGWMKFCLQLWSEIFQASGHSHSPCWVFRIFMVPSLEMERMHFSLLFYSFLSLSSFFSLPSHCHLRFSTQYPLYINTILLSSVFKSPSLPSFLPEMEQLQAGLQNVRQESDSPVFKFLELLLISLSLWASSLTSWWLCFLMGKNKNNMALMAYCSYKDLRDKCILMSI